MIKNFDHLSDEFEALSQKSFDTFKFNTVDQMITFSSLKITKEICSGIKLHLESAKARNENPISAERVKDGNYLMLFHFIIESMLSVFQNNKVDNESFITLNESVKNLISLSEKDNIYSESKIEFKSKETEAMFAEIFSEADRLLSKF